MLAHRIIPTLLCRGRQLIKGSRFDAWRSVGVATQAARIHQTRGVDELIILDIGATPENRGCDTGMIEELTADCFMPITVGGGIRVLEDVDGLFRAGADKVAIGTRVELIRPIAMKWGSQSIVAAVDVKDGTVWTHCGRKNTGYRPNDYAKMIEVIGAGEILLTSIDREGTMQGYDLDLVRRVSDAVSIPVIAHGGCSGRKDMVSAIEAGASAVAAGALFQFDDTTPQDCARHLAANGIEARV